MPSRTSPSPSPPPAAPEPASAALTPGPRAAALQKIYTTALKSTLKSNSYPNFASCFPTPARYCPTALEGVWRQLNTRLEEECSKDFAKILEERGTVAGLNTLDDLIVQARERKDRGIEGEAEPRALSTLTASELGDARLHGFLVKTAQELEEKLSGVQGANREAGRVVAEQRAEIERLVSGLESLVGDLQGAVNVLESREGGVDGEEMRREVWDLEVEMQERSGT